MRAQILTIDLAHIMRELESLPRKASDLSSKATIYRHVKTGYNLINSLYAAFGSKINFLGLLRSKVRFLHRNML